MTEKPDPKLVAARGAARLAVVQALFQMEQSKASIVDVDQQAAEGRLPLFARDEGEIVAPELEMDLDLFRNLTGAAVENQEALDTVLARRLAKGWRLERIDAVARAILRAGAAELWRRRDVPTPVIIDEYVEIAKAFFSGPEPSFVNATLDGCARDIRQDDAP